jgi:hypothetical protein
VRIGDAVAIVYVIVGSQTPVFGETEPGVILFLDSGRVTDIKSLPNRP